MFLEKIQTKQLFSAGEVKEPIHERRTCPAIGYYAAMRIVAKNSSAGSARERT
jgi:hypothetical protein